MQHTQTKPPASSLLLLQNSPPPRGKSTLPSFKNPSGLTASRHHSLKSNILLESCHGTVKTAGVWGQEIHGHRIWASCPKGLCGHQHARPTLPQRPDSDCGSLDQHKCSKLSSYSVFFKKNVPLKPAETPGLVLLC